MVTMLNPESIRPFGNRILVKRLALPEQSENGIYILGRDYPTMGRVLRVGNGPKTKYAQSLKVIERKNTKFGPQELLALNYRREIDIPLGSVVSWRIGPNFDQYDLGNDYLLLPYNELNFVIEKE
jgi:co-chaperonin GroES (HSP10)